MNTRRSGRARRPPICRATRASPRRASREVEQRSRRARGQQRARSLESPHDTKAFLLLGKKVPLSLHRRSSASEKTEAQPLSLGARHRPGARERLVRVWWLLADRAVRHRAPKVLADTPVAMASRGRLPRVLRMTRQHRPVQGVEPGRRRQRRLSPFRPLDRLLSILRRCRGRFLEGAEP